MISPVTQDGAVPSFPWAGLDGLTDPILIADPDGQLVHWNRAASTWFELPASPETHSNLRVLIHDYSLDHSGVQELWVAMHRGNRYTRITKLRTKHDSERQVRFELTPQRGATRSDQLVMLHIHDLTDIYKDFEQSEHQNRANVVLDLLGSTLSDLEYPLGALRWNAELPMEDLARLPDDLRMPFRSVQKASRHFVDMFSNLNLSLPESTDNVAEGGISLVRVLVTGSTPTRAAHLLDSLRSEGIRCVFRTARGRDELVRTVSSGEIDAVLLDRHISADKAADLAVAVAEVEPHLPVIACAELQLNELAERLREAMNRNPVVGASDEVWRRIEEIALRDSLTGVLNRRAFERFGRQEFERAKRYGFPMSMALFDLDHFKDVNDKLGHQAGDRLLQVFAAYLQTATRQSDMIARLGGDEFALLMSHTDGAGAFVLTQRLRDAVELHIREVLPPMEPATGVSAGLVIYPDQELESFEAFIGAADEALYRAKDAGKGCLDVRQ
ncbi:MAG: diguanylate cyclase [Planctomycetes bacterium]|nr:diguanylate cyclase [Planctomycetota bacterium]MCP4771949.1 diguanylate cyclase [Planctomycetota bacterium]MCP4860400.1 diguanylate cyclase [Planctomycetota bacterium]